MNQDVNLVPASLIIASRNRPALLLESVESILAGDQVPAELIVVDQSDSPNSRLERLPHPSLRYLHSRSIGLSRANNEGVAAARYDLLVFTHDDVLVTPEWFRTIVRCLASAGRRSVITGRVLPGGTELPGGFVPNLITDEKPAVYQGRIAADVLYPLNMAMFRSALDQVGGFDERLGPGTRFPGAEDNDLGFRLLEAGYRILYAPEATLYHRAWRKDYLALRWNYGRGMGAFYAKFLHLSDGFMLSRMRAEVLYRLRRFRHRGHKEMQLALGDGIYVAGMFSGALQWLLRVR